MAKDADPGNVMARGRKADIRRLQIDSAKRLISQTDLLHVMLNVWEGLDEQDQQEAIRAAGEKRAVKYQVRPTQTETPTEKSGSPAG